MGTTAAGSSALEALYEIAVLAADGQNDAARVARLAAEHASRLLEVEAAAFFAWDDRRGVLYPIYETPSERQEGEMRPGEGMVGQVFQTLAPLTVSDYQEYGEALTSSRGRGMRGAMAVPMQVDGRPIGVLGVWSYSVRHFSEEDVQLLRLFAAHVAPAFEAARLAEERERHVRTLSVLSRLAANAAGLLDIGSISRLAIDAVVELFEGSTAALSLWDPAADALVYVSDHEARLGLRTQPGRGAMGTAFATCRPAPIEDYQRYETAVAFTRRMGVQSVLAVPLLRGTEPVGALGVRFMQRRQFTAADIQLVQLLADQVTPALTAARLHEDLARSEATMRSVYTAMAGGVAVFDAAGRIVDVNDAALEQVGLRRDQLDGRMPADAAGLERIADSDLPMTAEDRPVARALQTGRPVRGAVIGYRRPDGTEFWLQHDAVPVLDQEGRVHRVVNSTIDVTAVRTAETARRENEAKSRFLASMSHELRTPLNSILGFAQLLDHETFGPLNDRQRRYVGHIESSGRHLLELVNDILDLSKVAAGQMEVNLRPVPLAEVTREVMARLRPLADARALRVRGDVPASLVAVADPRRLEQVLFNLLSNAIKFTPEGGQVALEARRRQDQVVVRVRDTGIGIAAPHHARIFEEFTQVDDGRARQHEGTGLGLAVTRRLVELMGGRITLASEPGRGSEFVFTLPRPQTLPAPGRPSSHAPA